MAYSGPYTYDLESYIQSVLQLSGPAPVINSDTGPSYFYPAEITIEAGQTIDFTGTNYIIETNGSGFSDNVAGSNNDGFNWYNTYNFVSTGWGHSDIYRLNFPVAGTYTVSFEYHTTVQPATDTTTGTTDPPQDLYGGGAITVHVTGLDLKFVQKKVANWGGLPEYQSSPAASQYPIANANTYSGWLAPISAASLLDYFRRKPGTGQVFPLYVGTRDQVMAYENGPFHYGYPSWRHFTLDANRPARNAVIESYDMTDWGWWMNTNNLGDSALPSVTTGFYGTTIKNIHNGLNHGYAHMGYMNSVFSMYKTNNTTEGTQPPEFTNNSTALTDFNAYFLMAMSLINNDKPFIVVLKSAIETTSDSIDVSLMDATMGEEYNTGPVHGGKAMSTSQWHADATSLALRVTSDTSAIGNAYAVIGYINNSGTSTIPASLRNKRGLILKKISGSPTENVFIGFDGKYDSNDLNELTGWDALLSTHIASPTPNNYISPRPALYLLNNFGLGACINVPKTMVSPINGEGTPQSNRFTAYINGAANMFRQVNGSQAGTTSYDPPNTPVTFTFNSAGVITVENWVYDGVTLASTTYPVNVSAPVDPAFILKDNLLQQHTGASITVPVSNPMWFIRTADTTQNLTKSADLSRITVTNLSGNPVSPSAYTLNGSVIGQTSNTSQDALYITFNQVGSYRVTYSRINGYCSSTYSVEFTVQTLSAFIDFSTGPAFVSSPIQFTDTSPQATSNWYWNFGDGNTSIVHNPTNVYTTASSPSNPYLVTFVADTVIGRLSVTKPLVVYYATANAWFEYMPKTGIIAGVTGVQFTEECTPQHPTFIPTTWLWDFGDGTSSTQKNPSHLYATPGVKTVTLNFSVNAGGQTLTASVSRQLTVEAASIYASSTTIIIPRNIAHTIDLTTLTGEDPDYSWSLIPDAGSVYLNQNLVTPNLVEYSPAENFTGIFSYRYKVTKTVNGVTQTATGKVTYIVRAPQVDLIVTGSSNYSVSTNSFGSYDVSFGSVELNQTKVKSMLLTNTGEADLYVNDMRLDGQDISLFQLQDSTGADVTSFGGFILIPGATYPFKLAFKPTTTGRKKVRIKIKHN